MGIPTYISCLSHISPYLYFKMGILIPIPIPLPMSLASMVEITMGRIINYLKQFLRAFGKTLHLSPVCYSDDGCLKMQAKTNKDILS